MLLFRTLLRRLGAHTHPMHGTVPPGSAANLAPSPAWSPSLSLWAWPDGEPLEATWRRLEAAAAAEVHRRCHPAYLAPGRARKLAQAQGRQP